MKKLIRSFTLLPLLVLAVAPAASTFAQQSAPNTSARSQANTRRSAEMQAFENAVTLYYHRKQADEIGQDVRAARPTGVREITIQIQIFLDQAGFGPGVIDGRPGEFTHKAFARYQRAHGLPVTGKLEDALHQIPFEEIKPMYAAHVITEEDDRQVGPLPKKPAEQSKLKRMRYSSLHRFLEERYHTSPELLHQINPALDITKLKVGDTVYVPNVTPFRVEDVKPVGKLPVVEEYKSRRRIEVDTREKFLELYEDDKLIAAFPITPGSSSNPAPAGKWRIVGIATLPWYRWDEGVLKRGVRTDHFYNIPAGPTSPVGVVWMGLNKPGIGVHGTNSPQTIGRAGSSGCIRLANWDAIRLASMVSTGTPVIIDGGSADTAGR